MASREEIYTAKILINDKDAEVKLKNLKQQLETLKRRRDEAFRDGKIDVWKALNREIKETDKNIAKQTTLVQGLNRALDNMSTAKQKEKNSNFIFQIKKIKKFIIMITSKVKIFQEILIIYIRHHIIK